MTERPFIPRPAGKPAWWAEPMTAAELAEFERQRRERETLSGVRHGDD